MKVYPFCHFPPLPGEIDQEGVIKLNTGNLNNAVFSNDAAFDWLYPQHFQLLSLKHWTPLELARKAAEFLAEPGAKVLDIGSGIGKFCLAAGHFFPGTHFYGVEQRHELIYLAREAKRYTKLSNVNFIYANITQINFKEFDHFYFYNSFYENIDHENKIDDTIELSESLYSYYNQYLCAALDKKPSGTRLVTFHSFEREIPSDFKLAAIACNGLMKMWIKT
jgi:hypothetical protein